MVYALLQGFLTAMRQEIARANKYALDVAALTNEVTRMGQEEVSRVPTEGKHLTLCGNAVKINVIRVVGYLQ